MAKLKDGFYKLTAESIGNDSYVLLAGGGSKALSDFATSSGSVTALGTNGNYVTWTKNGTVNNLTVPYATKADTVDGFHITSWGKYAYRKLVSDATGSTWYAKVVFNISWNLDKHYICFNPGYNNVNGKLYFTITSHAGSGYIAQVSSYNGCNIKAFYVNIEDSKLTMYLQLTGNASAACYMYSTLEITSFTVVSSPSVTFTEIDANVIYTDYGIKSPNFYGTAATAGSASKWTTARTLTIGHKEQSVNGTANVTWDLHDVLCASTQIGASTSWLISDPGVYYVASTSAFTGDGNPESANGGLTPYRYGQLIVSRATKGGVAQFYISHKDSSDATNGIKYRTGWNSTYQTTWASILDSSNYTLYVNTTSFPGLNKTGTITGVTAGAGLSGGGTSGSVTLTNAGVRSITINGDYLRVNTNGTNNDLTIPYATNAKALANYYSSRPTSIAPGVTGDGSMFHFLCTSAVTDTTTDPGDAHILHFNWDNKGGYDFQIAGLTGESTMKIRGMNGGTWKPWATVLSSENYTSYIHLYEKTIDASYKTAFRTQTKGDTNNGYYISAIRCDTASVDAAPLYGSGLAFGKSDTHGYLYVDYSAANAYIGGGNADKLNWTATLLHSSNYTSYINTTNYPGLNKVGTVTSVTVTGANGLSGSGTVTSSGTITLSNSGVRSTTINGNYLRVNTNGTNADLTIPYATTAGSANSVAWGNITGKPSSYTPSAHNHSYIKGGDNRNVDNDPSWYMTNLGTASVYTEFSLSGGAVSGTYENRTTFTPWTNNSGQRPVQLAFNNSGVFMRTSKSDTEWNSWYTVYHSGNLTKSTIGLENVQNTAFYKRPTTVNGTVWDMAGTNNSAAFTIYAPTTAGTTGQVLTSTAGAPGWTNQSSLSVGYATSAGNADTLDGFTRRKTSDCTWGTLTASNNYTPIYWGDTTNSGGIGFSDKNGQTSMQIDGSFYQNEGRNRVTDVTETVTALGTNGNYLTWTKNGTVNNLTVPYAINANNSNKLGGSWKYQIQAAPSRSLLELYDTLPLLQNDIKIHDTNCEVVKSGELTAPYDKVWKCTGSIYWYPGVTLYFTPGETICIESWIMRPTGATGTTGTYYLGIEFKDKLGKPINANNGTVYFNLSSAWTCPCNGIWYRRYDEYTIPTTHTAYNGSDGGGFFSGTIRCLINYDKGTIPTYFGGFKIYKRNIDICALGLTQFYQPNVNSCYDDLKLKYYTLHGCNSSVSTDGNRYAGTENSYGFPVENNANSMLWLGSYSNNYGHQLGFSSNGRIYDRYISAGSFPTTANGGSWKKIAYTSDIPTVTNYYWADIKVSSSSSTETTPTFKTATATVSVTTPLVSSTDILTLNAAKTGLLLKFNNDNTKSVILNATAFKPFEDANDKLTLGSSTARWSNVYSVKGDFSGLTSIRKDLGGNLSDWINKQHNGPLEVGRSTNTMCVTIGVTDDNYGYIQCKGYGITSYGKLVLQPSSDGALYATKNLYTILHSGNSSVSGGGSSWGSSITVNIGGTSKTLTIPANPNSDTKVTQTNTTGNSSYRVLLSGSANDTDETTTARKSDKLRFNTSTGKMDLSGLLLITTSITDHANPAAQCLVINSTAAPSGTTLSLKNSPGIGFHIANTGWASLVFGPSGFNFINDSATAYQLVNVSTIKCIANSKYISITPANDSYVHYTTDADIGHYFNTTVHVNGAVAPYGNNTYTSGTVSYRWSNVYAVKGNFSGQITASVATGTSPFNITSTTVNTNLNADMVDGYNIWTGTKTQYNSATKNNNTIYLIYSS